MNSPPGPLEPKDDYGYIRVPIIDGTVEYFKWLLQPQGPYNEL
jgi:hypothetical protein